MYVQEFQKGGPTSDFKLLTELGAETDSFQHETISIGYTSTSTGTDEEIMNWIIGSTNGSQSATSKVTNLKGSTFNPNITDKILVKKNEPVVIGVWSGSKNGQIHTHVVSGDGTLPEGIKKMDVSYVFKVKLVDKNP